MSITQFAMVEELAFLIRDNLRSKHLVLAMEDTFVNFLQHDTSSDGVLELEPMDPYNRLLLHRLADIFGDLHEISYVAGRLKGKIVAASSSNDSDASSLTASASEKVLVPGAKPSSAIDVLVPDVNPSSSANQLETPECMFKHPCLILLV
ncbi:hypothetical protein LINPERHAP1_LOCUS2796 [Linum perenne]